MLINIKKICQEIADERNITLSKKDLDIYELTKLREIINPKNKNISNLIFIGSRPGMGKTTLALDIVLDAAIFSNKKILIFSLELTSKQMVARLIKKLSGISLRMEKNSEITEEDKNKLSVALAFLQGLNILIDDTPMITPSYIKKCIQNCEKPDIVMIDYIQLVFSDHKNDNRMQETREIIRSLRQQSQKFCIQMLVLSQVKFPYREDQRPRLDDIRPWGFSAENFNIVLFIYRESYYVNDFANDDAEIIVAKNNTGECGTINMRFDSNTISFKDCTQMPSKEKL